MKGKRSKSPSGEVRVSRECGGVRVACDSLSKEFAVQRDVREGVKGNVRAEARGVRDARWNRVSPDGLFSDKPIVS